MYATTRDAGADALIVDSTPAFDLSPYLYMQFMEPLGTTDGSVEAAWDHLRGDWRPDVIEVTKDLAPAMIRWGGIVSQYYRWKEGVGPRDRRRPMVNLAWGGVESSQVGTAEFVALCRRVGADPLISINFESDGRSNRARPRPGVMRSAGPREAAEWVDYCNNPGNAMRRRHGSKDPYDVRLWQIGNETSYGRGGYDCETAARRTVAFAKAMRARDPAVELIGWGDSGWGARMLDVAGEHLQYLAFHNMFRMEDPDTPLRGVEYRKDPAATWDALMEAWRKPAAKIARMREEVGGRGVPLAMTECHFALEGRNRCEVLSSWAAGVANARVLNVHERNGDILKIATLADFCGTRWQVNAVMIPAPRGRSFMMPVARVMSLYRKHTGRKAVGVTAAPGGLDVVASRTGRRVFLHVVNTKRTAPVKARIAIQGAAIESGRVFEIAADPQFEAIEYDETLAAREKAMPPTATWTFPPASVTAVDLRMTEALPPDCLT